jgi:hypothetical protein
MLIFRSSLKQLREKHKVRYPNSPFKEPSAYKPRKKPVRLAALSTSAHPPETLPALVELQQRMSHKAKGNMWLWDACIEIIQGTTGSPFVVPSDEQRIAYLDHALRYLPDYPTRTSPPAKLPVVLEALRLILDEGPPKGARIHRHLLISQDPATGAQSVFWSDTYLESVFCALIDVIRMRGWGPKSGQAARWMIYDKVRSCL